MPSFLSKELSSLIELILIADPKERISIKDIKSHPWYCPKDDNDNNDCSHGCKGLNSTLPSKDDPMMGERKEGYSNTAATDKNRSINRELHLTSRLRVHEVMTKIRQQLDRMGFKLDEHLKVNDDDDNNHDFTTKATRITPYGMIGIAVSAWEVDDNCTKIEFRKGKGDIMEYHSFLDELIGSRLEGLFER